MNISIVGIHDFIQLFTGNAAVHGVFLPNGEKEENGKVKGSCFTEPGEAKEELYIAHLEGHKGLGIVPICDNNEVNFSVIDIDEYADHSAIIKMVYAYTLPLCPFRSKSGGLHMYMFFDAPVKASEAVKIMSRFRTMLSLPPKTEIFPKQTTLLKEGSGSWINLPYFKAEQTERYLYRSDGSAASFDEMLEHCKNMCTTVEKIQHILADLPLGDGPPCLQSIYLLGDTQFRNQYLFSLARYFKAKVGDDFEYAVIDANQKLDRPIPLDELNKTIIQSHKKKEYAYRCSDEPLCSLCSKTLCKTMEFGVGSDNISELTFEDFIQYMTDPPYYEWIINSSVLRFHSEMDVINQTTFRALCFRELHILPARMKDNVWTRIVNTALKNVKVKKIEAGEDISPGALFKEYLVEFLTKRAMAQTKEQILIDRVYKDEDNKTYVFKSRNLITYLLYTKQFKYFGQTEIHERLTRMGGMSLRYYVGGNGSRNTRVWTLPWNALDAFIDPEIDSIALDFQPDETEDEY